MRPRAKTVPWLRQGDEIAVALNPVPADLRRLADPDRSVEWVLRHADGTRSLTDLAAAGPLDPTTLDDVLNTLDAAGLLIDADELSLLPASETRRWRNNLGFFEAYATVENGPVGYHDQLRAARVLLLGAGGLGSMMLMNLVGLGVGEIVLVDFDDVEEANFSRQFTYRQGDIGQLKVTRAADWAREFSGHTKVSTREQRIESADDVADLLEGMDLVVSAIDQPTEAPLWVNAAAYRAGVPSVYGGFFYTKGRYESVWPGRSACLACLTIGETFEMRPVNRATGPSVSVVGGLMALEVVRYLTGFAPPAAAAQSWIVDFRTGAVSESVRWGRSPNCLVCADPADLNDVTGAAHPTNAADPAHSGEAIPRPRTASSPVDSGEPTMHSRVDVRHLTVQPDGSDFLVGDLTRGIFVAVPPVGAHALQALQRGATIAEATSSANLFAGTDVNVLEFVGVLRSRGLIGTAPAVPTEASPETASRLSILRSRIAGTIATSLLSVPALSLYLLTLLSGLAIIVFDPGLRPSWEGIVFLTDPALSLLVYIGTAVTLAGLHEGFHWLAARRVGLPAQLRVSRRGLFLVFETDLTRLWAVPRNQRYVAFLAGMAFDGTVLGSALIARLAHQQGWISLPETLNRYLAIIVLAAVVALIGQTPVFMRTDLYAVLVAALGCHNLYRTSMLIVKGRLVRLSPAERSELAANSDRDLQVGRWFGGLYLIGVIGLGYVLFGLFVPAVFSLVVWSLQNVGSTSPGSVVFWEALLVAAFLTAEVVWPMAHWLTGRVRALLSRTPDNERGSARVDA
jgi:putative peptide zinc metalloprotease protein